MSEYSMHHHRSRRPAAGFTLIELMVAMLLGLIVIAGVTSVFLAGQQTYRANGALGEVQDGSRVAFELLAHDIRGAGVTGCDGSSGRVANVINTPPWYADWTNTLHGYDDASTDPALTSLPTTGATSPVAGTSSIHLVSTTNLDVMVSSVASGNPANININAASTQLGTGDLVMVCDFDHATILQVDSYTAGSTVITHNTGGAIPPGNCSEGLGYPTICSATGNAYTFLANARMALLTGSVWYLGNNSVNTTSLYRLAAVSSAAGTAPTAQEMVRNVSALQISYLPLGGSAFGNAASVGNWSAVDAAQIQLTVKSTDQRAGVNTKPLVRTFTSTTTVRNRVL